MTDAELLVAALVMAVGLLGVLLPVIPGLLLIWGVGVFWALQEEGAARWAVLAVLSVLAVAGTLAKYLLSSRAASAAGAPRSTILAGAAGAVVGFFVVPVLGLVIGGVAGVLLAERSRLGHWRPAWRATKAFLVGFGLGMALELAAALVMVLVWATAALVLRA